MAKIKGAGAPRAELLADGTLMIYGVIGDEWDGLGAAQVTRLLRTMAADDPEEIRVLLNSPGGSVTEGLAIYNELKAMDARVVVEITALAASMGSVIAMAGDEIRMAGNAHVMVHNPWLVASGNAEDLRKAAELLDRLGTSIAGIYAERTGREEEEIRAYLDAETWFTAEEALAAGFIDSITGETDAEAFAPMEAWDLAAIPAALAQLITKGNDMKNQKTGTGAAAGAGAAAPPEPATEPTSTPAADPAPATPTVDAAALADRAVAAERQRIADIRTIASRHGLGEAFAVERINSGASIEAVRKAALEDLAVRSTNGAGPGVFPTGASITADERDKFRTGALAWILTRAGQARNVATATGETLDPGEFRGMSLLDLARESLNLAGVKTRGLGRRELAGLALGVNRAQGAMVQTTSDFPILMENALRKMLLAAYGVAPDTWRQFCAVGSVADFRPHPRLRLGSLSRLEKLLESGEIRAKNIPDATKESIRADTFANIVGISRQVIVNDDVDGFSRTVAMLGRAAALSVEVDVYGLLQENAGLGPTMNDGNPLFHNRGAGANNIVGTAGPPSVAAFEAARVALAEMTDPSGNEILDLRPAAWVGPISQGGEARVVNAAEYDTDDVAADSTNRFMKPNKVRGLFSTVVDTPRLPGTRQYIFADPAVAPVVEVAFLEGNQAPVIEPEPGFDFDGVRWRVLFDYGVGAIDWRGAVTNAGA